MAVLAPMPRARVITATNVKVGFFSRLRNPNRMSRINVPMRKFPSYSDVSTRNNAVRHGNRLCKRGTTVLACCYNIVRYSGDVADRMVEARVTAIALIHQGFL